MTVPTKLSYSAITTYTTCGYKYFLRYRNRFRGIVLPSPLAFGSAIDSALNTLLTTKDLVQALAEFEKSWSFQFFNKKYISLSKNLDMVYSTSDFDHELLTSDDTSKLNALYNKLDVGSDYLNLYNQLANAQKEGHLVQLDVPYREFYAYCNWLSLYRKGKIMVENYNQKIMPRIKEVLAVQKEHHIENQEGDKLTQHIDLIVRWENDSIVLFDNKTATKAYDQYSPSLSPQLLSYFHGLKSIYGLHQIGYIVLNKIILKNKTKICDVCGYDGSGERFRTCSSTPDGITRCGGEWITSVNPECKIDVIVNNVPVAAENLVMTSFDEANQGIKKENWYRNLSACRSTYGPCEFEQVCWNNDTSQIVVIDEN